MGINLGLSGKQTQKVKHEIRLIKECICVGEISLFMIKFFTHLHIHSDFPIMPFYVCTNKKSRAAHRQGTEKFWDNRCFAITARIKTSIQGGQRPFIILDRASKRTTMSTDFTLQVPQLSKLVCTSTQHTNNNFLRKERKRSIQMNFKGSHSFVCTKMHNITDYNCSFVSIPLRISHWNKMSLMKIQQVEKGT